MQFTPYLSKPIPPHWQSSYKIPISLAKRTRLKYKMYLVPGVLSIDCMSLRNVGEMQVPIRKQGVLIDPHHDGLRP